MDLVLDKVKHDPSIELDDDSLNRLRNVFL